jgi:hypothetical protein
MRINVVNVVGRFQSESLFTTVLTSLSIDSDNCGEIGDNGEVQTLVCSKGVAWCGSEPSARARKVHKP